MKKCCSNNESNTSNNINVETKHLNTYRTIWNIINLLANIVGIDVMTYNDIELNFRFVVTNALIFIAFASIFYTMVVVWPNASLLLEVVCLFGVLLPVCVESCL